MKIGDLVTNGSFMGVIIKKHTPGATPVVFEVLFTNGNLTHMLPSQLELVSASR